MEKIRSTTVCAVSHNGKVAIGADGQATMGTTVAKTNVKKIRKLLDGKIFTGFAGSTADAFTLLEKFEEKLNSYSGNMKRAAIELAKDWRSDRALRKLEALLAVANHEASLIITGNGDVIQPEDDLIAIGSGGSFAQASARALLENTELSARDIVAKSLTIAGDICVYTNQNQTIEELTF